MNVFYKMKWLIVASMLTISFTSHGEMRTATGPYKYISETGAVII